MTQIPPTLSESFDLMLLSPNPILTVHFSLPHHRCPLPSTSVSLSTITTTTPTTTYSPLSLLQTTPYHSLVEMTTTTTTMATTAEVVEKEEEVMRGRRRRTRTKSRLWWCWRRLGGRWRICPRTWQRRLRSGESPARWCRGFWSWRSRRCCSG